MDGGSNKQIFRQTSLDRISSPEQLNDYLHVTNPGIWVFLAVIILLLVGFFAWSFVGKLETTAKAEAYSTGDEVMIMTSEAYDLKAGMKVRIMDREMTITYVEKDEEGTRALAPAELPAGQYDAEVVLESISPIGFLIGQGLGGSAGE